MYNYNHCYRRQKTFKIKIIYTMARFKCENFYICNNA